jgi:Zn finger protein HypA/HybF involved in hydrogenase expression
MHEYGVARDIVRQALTQAEACGASRVTGLRIGVGPGENIDREALAWSIRAAASGTLAEGVALEIADAGPAGLVLESIELETIEVETNEEDTEEVA